MIQEMHANSQAMVISLVAQAAENAAVVNNNNINNNYNDNAMSCKQ